MSARRLLPTFTPSRRDWLRRLSVGPAARTGWGIVPCQCARLGWTDWVRDKTGQPVPGIASECLTDAGRAKLAEWERQ